MKNADLWAQHEFYTNALSENSRKLAFAAVGISWLFKNSDNSFPELILLALGFVITFFIADILQYLFGALSIRFWTRYHEKKMWKAKQTIDGDYQKPAWLDLPSFSMWWLKVVSLLTGYIFIGIYVFYKNAI